MCIHMVAQHHTDIEAKLGDIAEIHGIRRVAFAQHGVAMLVEGHCRKTLGQSVGNHSLSGAWEELDHLRNRSFCLNLAKATKKNCIQSVTLDKKI